MQADWRNALGCAGGHCRRLALAPEKRPNGPFLQSRPEAPQRPQGAGRHLPSLPGGPATHAIRTAGDDAASVEGHHVCAGALRLTIALSGHSHEDGKLPSMWQYDLFHVWHLGMGKLFCGNMLALLSDTYPAGKLEDRFDLLTGDYLVWCKQNHCNAWVKKLTPKLIGWPTRSSWPNGIWYKGQLTTSLMKFFESFYAGKHFEEPMLRVAMEACQAVNHFLRLLFSAELFLPKKDAEITAGYGLRFLRRYETLAQMASARRLCLWSIQPKAHAFQHICLGMHDQLKDGSRAVLNPLCWATQPDEDFTGRPSRLSRRTRPGKVQVHRVLQRHLKASYDEWKKMGYIHPTRRSVPGA